MNTLEYCLSVVVECSLMPVKFLLFFFLLPVRFI